MVTDTYAIIIAFFPELCNQKRQELPSIFSLWQQGLGKRGNGLRRKQHPAQIFQRLRQQNSGRAAAKKYQRCQK